MARIRVEGLRKRFDAGAGRASGAAAAGRARELFGRDFGGVAPEEDLQAARIAGRGQVMALDDVSLEIPDGETLCVIGPSGCGKTTLLRVIAGLEDPDAGRVLYDADDVTAVAPKDRRIGIVFQNYALYPHMDAKNNLAFFFRMHKRDREVDERVRITSEILGVGFDELLDRKPKELSGGQRQRVAIGRCIVREPRLFLFDEPLSNLDAKLRVRTRVEIKRLLARFRITAVYVTHDQTEAIALADRIAVMRHGRIEQVGTYWDIYERPSTEFVAGFVGLPSMNLFPAAFSGGELRLDGGRVAVAAPPGAALSERASLTLGIRPEHVALLGPDESGDLAGTVEVIEPLPSERRQIVHLRSGGLNIVAVAPLDEPVQRGETRPLRLDPARLHLFDAGTGRRVAMTETAEGWSGSRSRGTSRTG